MMIDHVLSIRIVTSDKKIVEVTSSSTGEDLALFHALCGAGNGLGVVTSLTMKVFPLENLRLSKNGVWVRKLVFSASEIELAAELFDKIQPPPPPMVVSLVCARAPPTAPKPGAPIIIFTVTYYGPADEAETRTSILFEGEPISKAISVQTVLTPLFKLNDGLNHFDVHGGFKDIQSAWITETQPETIIAAFKEWLDFTAQHDDTKRTTIVLNSSSIQKQLEIQGTSEGRARYFDARDRGVHALIISWFTKAETRSAATDFAAGIKALYRQKKKAAEPPRTILNNIGPSSKPDEVLVEHRVADLKRLADFWDPTALFWKPWN
jgi:hypothetical protein